MLSAPIAVVHSPNGEGTETVGLSLGNLSTAGIVTAAAAMALQPDRAMAGMLALCLFTLAVIHRDRHVAVELAAGVVSFATTLARTDALPAVPYVDQILYSSFQVNVGAGLAILGGVATLIMPVIIGWTRDVDNRATYAAFGTVWFAAIAAAALGNYPNPIVGYGGSAVDVQVPQTKRPSSTR